MSTMSSLRCILLILLFSTCALIVHGRGGRGGGGRSSGGSRGGGSSSSRSSSSSSSSYGGGSSSKYGSSSSSGGSSSKYGSSSSSSGGYSSKYGSSSSSSGGYSSKYGSSSSSSGGGSSSKYGSSSGSSSSSFKHPSSSSSSKDSYSGGSVRHKPTYLKDYDAEMAQERARINAVMESLRNSQSSSAAANYPRQGFSHNPVIPFKNSQLGSPSGSIANANYPKQQFSYNPTSFGNSQQGPASQGIPNANYPRQPISHFQGIPSHNLPPQPGISNANYPRQPSLQQPSVHSGASSPQASISNANYPRLPNPHQTFGSSSQQNFQNANYPRQAINPNPSVPLVRSPPLGHQPNQPSGTSGLYSHPQSGISSANYPRQPSNYQSLPPQVLGSGVWNPKSGMPAPVYMNYGGLPTGANMYTKPMKKQGFLGSLMSIGGSGKSYKSKHYGSYPSPYGMGGGMPSNVLGGFMGNKGSKTAMYTILPYKVARKSSKLFKPKFGFYSYRPIRYHSYHHHSYMHEPEYASVHYDVYNNDYVGRCNRPIKPDHATIVCNSTHNQVECDVTCEEGYRYPDNTTSKTNKCWHVSGTWNPTKNFPGCKPVCYAPCLNGGKCVRPGVCGCPSEYRGPHCELHFLNCDIRKLANGTKILWVCTHTRNETSCRVKCKSPAKFVPQSELFYKCSPEGVWTPSTMPLCVVPSGSKEEHVTIIPEENVIKVKA